MSIATMYGSTEQLRLRSAQPGFAGIVYGEIFKVSRQWLTWIMFVLWLGAMCVPAVFMVAADSTRSVLLHTPLGFYYRFMEYDLEVLRAFVGIFLIIVTANVIGLEYQLGTIRIQLARGVGRIQLLSAKLLAIVIIALALFVFDIVLQGLLTLSVAGIVTGNFDTLRTLTPAFWSATGDYMLSTLISMGATILMAACMSVVGRSLSIGLSAALAWFPLDNIGIPLMLVLAGKVTHSDFWLNIIYYFLGPNLNGLGAALLPAKAPVKAVLSIFPLPNLTSTHALLVILAYSAVFAGVAFVLTWKRDVKE
jgi:ABC-2 type transport system permease protein